MVEELSRQLLADTVTRTVKVRVRPGTAQDVPGEGVGRGTEYQVRLNVRRERPRAIGTREGLQVVEVGAEPALTTRAEVLIGRPARAVAGLPAWSADVSGLQVGLFSLVLDGGDAEAGVA